MKTVSIDRKRKLRDEPHTGHNRWHPDIPPVIEVDEGEEVALETRDALDGHLHAKSTEADFASMATGAIHPLTGPVLVKGARPGDLLEVEFTDIVPERWAFTAIFPGLGFLRDVMTTPFLVHWTIADGWATSPGLASPAMRRRGFGVLGAFTRSLPSASPSRHQGWPASEGPCRTR